MGPTEGRNELVAVGVTAVQLLGLTMPERTRYSIRNSSVGAQVVTLSFGSKKAPVVNEGFPLLPGDVWAESDSGDFRCFKGMITAISDVAGAQVSLVEI